MPDEIEFDKALRLAGNFINMHLKSKLKHPFLPGQFLETDNLAQKYETVFVFEGKEAREDDAIKQLQIRQLSLKFFRLEYIKKGVFQDYKNIRLFYYSIKRKIISEYNSSGMKISSQKFNNLNELAQILRKL